MSSTGNRDYPGSLQRTQNRESIIPPVKYKRIKKIVLEKYVIGLVNLVKATES